MTNPAPILTKNPIYRFRNLGNAESWVHHGVKPQWIMLGDDETFWVGHPGRRIPARMLGVRVRY